MLAFEYFHHEAKIVYGKLDLDNILITSKKYIKLTDFAVTKSYSPAEIVEGKVER